MPPITISPGADIHLVVGMSQVIVAHAYLDTGERDIAADPATANNGFGAVNVSRANCCTRSAPPCLAGRIHPTV
jgi:hypothetical protein